MKLNRFFILILFVLSISSCKNYESEQYLKMENEAIGDIILEMTKFEEMKQIRSWNNEKLNLYIISRLDTSTAKHYKPTGFTIAIDGIYLSHDEVEQNKKEYEEDLAIFTKENDLFSELKTGKIESRDLNSTIVNDQLNIQLIDEGDFRSTNTQENELGYLFISRIIFNRSFSKGYLHFSFICGTGCAWGNNIEITKVNGKWTITEYFSGWIA